MNRLIMLSLAGALAFGFVGVTAIVFDEVVFAKSGKGKEGDGRTKEDRNDVGDGSDDRRIDNEGGGRDDDDSGHGSGSSGHGNDRVDRIQNDLGLDDDDRDDRDNRGPGNAGDVADTSGGGETSGSLAEKIIKRDNSDRF